MVVVEEARVSQTRGRVSSKLDRSFVADPTQSMSSCDIEERAEGIARMSVEVDGRMKEVERIQV